MKTKLTQLEQQALQAMMNPHFIFNVINSIQYFINAGDKEKANKYLADFAKLIRLNSGFSGKKVVLLKDEIAYLNLYLFFEKLRFGRNLTYEIAISKVIDPGATSISVMMIQPFLENAIWHGILPMNTQGHLKLNIARETGDMLKIKVSDNGVGIKSLFTGYNLLSHFKEANVSSIVIQRLQLLAKSSEQELYLRYTYLNPKQENKGTIAEFIMPAVFN